MTMYCTCQTCASSPAKPHGCQMHMETIDGLFVMMEPGWTLAHWGPGIFQNLYATEIHRFVHLENKAMVGASFYLYTADLPAAAPRQLRMLGIGGGTRYVIDDWVLGNQLNAFYKNQGVTDSETRGGYREVAVALGCGGYIRFDANRKGVSYVYTGTDPELQKPRS